MKSSPYIGLLAIFLLVFGLWQGARVATLEATGIRTEGRMVRFEQERRSSSSGGYSTYYDPIVKFRTQDNREVEFKDYIGGYLPIYLLGPKVTVLYSAADPRGSAMIDLGRYLNWVMPAFTLLAALFAIGIALSRLLGGGSTAEPAATDDAA